MASKRSSMVMFMVVMVMGAMHMESSDAATYTVGDSLGWTIPAQDPNAYITWAASKTFRVDDIIVFNFATNSHTVAEVTKTAYDACTLTSPISTWTNGPASVTLNSSGSHYYLCTIPGHCSAGQKLAITVSAAASPAPTPTAAPPTPTAAPPTPLAAPPTPTAAPTPTPAPASTPSPSPASAPTPSSGAPASLPSESTPSPPAPTPGSTTPSTPAPGSPDIPTPPAPSSASFLSAALPLTFLSIAMAYY